MSTPGSSASAAANPRDPSGYITSPPSVAVKVVGTARDDINGLLGIVVSYNMERERYLVHMTTSQSTMALKKENLQKASMMESYRSQWEQLKNDPRVREKVSHYVRWCQQQVHPFNLWHVVGGICLLFVIMLWLFGFTKCIMMTSLFILLLIIVLPDLLARTPWQLVVRRFPTRARETLEQQMPFLRGRLTDGMALGIVMLVVAFCVQSLFVSGKSSVPKPTALPPVPPVSMSSQTARVASSQLPVLDKDAIEKYYHLGFQDATKGKEAGFSIQDELEKLENELQSQRAMMEERATAMDDNLGDVDGNFDYFPPPPQESKSLLSRLLNFSSIGSMLYIYRMLKEKGTDPNTGLFSAGQLAANLQHNTELWQQGMLAFSIYNLLRIVLSW